MATKDRPAKPQPAPAAPARPSLPCDRCVDPARVRVKTRLGWQHLCHKCNDRRVQHEADEYCRSVGLDTLEKQKAFCRAAMKHGIATHAPNREPGQDDEERGR